MQIIPYILKYTQLPEKSILNTVALLNEDCTVPFISRYRKERTGNLDEVQITAIVELKEQFEALVKRKKAIIKAVEEQGLLSTELKTKFESATDLIQLEDLYLPFKKSKKTKAEVARKNGLEPLAKIIMAQRADELDYLAGKYLSAEVQNEDEALEGARHIIAEWINERSDIRNQIRSQLERFAQITTKVIGKQKDGEKAQKYRDYFDWSESLNRCPSHRFLAISRAASEKFVRIKIEIDEERTLQRIEQRIIKNPNTACAKQIQIAIADAFKRLLFPSLSNELLKSAKEKADEDAIAVFAKNLRQLLLSAPLGEKNILAIDPGFRSGCKVVCLDAQGNLVHNETLYPHAPQSDVTGAIKKLSSLANAYKIEAIAIGNGTASRETERLIKKVIFKNPVEVYVVSEAGASIYSASKIARDEFPNYDVTVRGAVSIGRRSSLDRVVESCVNSVGVNINTASVPLLSYVSGIGPKLADNMVNYRKENGAFSSRSDIKKVARLGGKAFEQGAGFLRIKDASNPLDDSAVHPESYGIVKQMAKDRHIPISTLVGNTTELQKINLQNYCTETVGLPTEKAKVFTFDQNIRAIEDLRDGQLLPGIVNNITNFGCFVDIGIKESGLIHVSNLSDTFVKDVNAHVHLHQQLIVKVLSVDIARKRIQLALHKKT